RQIVNFHSACSPPDAPRQPGLTPTPGTEKSTPMTSHRRLLIAANDARAALSVQAHLGRALQLAAPIVRLDEVPNLLTPETDGDVLLVVPDPADAPAAEAVVRETKIQQLPTGLAVAESEQVRGYRLLDNLDAHLAGRWLWPQEGRELTAWARRGLTPG